MTRNINSINHPCYGMCCEMCESCIFDEDIFDDKKTKKMKKTCNNCTSLVKNFIDDNRLQFNACCNRCLVDYNTYTRPRVIQHKTGSMLEIETPSWCPKERGITKEYCVEKDTVNEIPNTETKMLPLFPTTTTTVIEPVKLTYTEKRERLKNLKKHIEWNDIKEGNVYVIPKILSQQRKVVRVIAKTDNMIRCSEIDEYGKESQYCTNIYPSDIDTTFIIAIHKF